MTSFGATYLFGLDVAEHGDLLFDRVLQSGGAAAHDLSAKAGNQRPRRRVTDPCKERRMLKKGWTWTYF